MTSSAEIRLAAVAACAALHAAGCDPVEPAFSIEITNPTDCADVTPEVTNYWMELTQSDASECDGGGCEPGDPRTCLAGVTTPEVIPGEPLSLAVGVYDARQERVACGRSGEAQIDDGSTIFLTLSCANSTCPSRFRVTCPDQ